MKLVYPALAVMAAGLMMSACNPFGQGAGKAPADPAQPNAAGPLGPKPDGATPAPTAGAPGKPTGAAPAAPPPPAPAPTGNTNDAQLRQLVSGYLDNYGQQLAGGYQRNTALSDYVAPLQPGQTMNWGIRLQPGVTYKIIGACDNECSDVDLTVVDSRGTQIDQDILLDDYPVLDFTVPADGFYSVQISMVTCTAAPCYAAARVYQQ